MFVVVTTPGTDPAARFVLRGHVVQHEVSGWLPMGHFRQPCANCGKGTRFDYSDNLDAWVIDLDECQAVRLGSTIEASPAKAPWRHGTCCLCSREICPPIDGDGAKACRTCDPQGLQLIKAVVW